MSKNDKYNCKHCVNKATVVCHECNVIEFGDGTISKPTRYETINDFTMKIRVRVANKHKDHINFLKLKKGIVILSNNMLNKAGIKITEEK